MKKPHWLEKEKLYSIIFESDTPMGRMFDIALIVAISLSIIISFIETVPSLAHTFKLVLEILEYLLTFFFTVEYIARVYCSPRKRDYVLSFLASLTCWPSCRLTCRTSCPMRDTGCCCVRSVSSVSSAFSDCSTSSTRGTY